MENSRSRVAMRWARAGVLTPALVVIAVFGGGIREITGLDGAPRLTSRASPVLGQEPGDPCMELCTDLVSKWLEKRWKEGRPPTFGEYGAYLEGCFDQCRSSQ